MKPTCFSGVQPSGNLHIGNYLGAIKNWVSLQDEYNCIFCVVDEHAITVPQDPKKLKDKILEIAAIYLAAGIDPKKSVIFVQSQVPAHAELAWILNTITKIPELERMTQFKDKSEDHRDKINMGLFSYPVLMAADILLYNTNIVPTGEDQKQHIEIASDLAKRFNNLYGTTFIIPKAIIKPESKKIMGLDDPLKKMSKSAASPYNYIALTDSADIIRKKIKKAVTDSGDEIKFSPDKPAISNLLTIYSLLSEEPIRSIEEKFKGKGYGDFKKSLADVIVGSLEPFQDKFNKIISNKKKLVEILTEGQKRASVIAEKTLAEVKEKVGLGI